jgi:hypothetical protein
MRLLSGDAQALKDKSSRAGRGHGRRVVDDTLRARFEGTHAVTRKSLAGECHAAVDRQLRQLHV